MNEHDAEGSADRPVRLAFLISSGASHVLAVAEAVRQGRLPHCEVAIILCNIPGAHGAEATRAAGLQTVTMEGRGREQRDHEEAIDALLRRMRVDLICLAGYLRTLSGAFLRKWPDRVLSIHSSLLPAFPRSQPVAQALEYGAQVTGCTVSLMTDALDGGVILAQRAVPIEDDDTVQSVTERLLVEEHEAYINAIGNMLSGEYEIVGRKFRRRALQEHEAHEGAVPGFEQESAPMQA